MRIIAFKTLREFWDKHPDAEQWLRSWYHDAKHANWKTPNDIKQVYATASIIAENRVAFNVKGNQYRLVVAIHYASGIVFVRFVGTHQEYDKVDARTI